MMEPSTMPAMAPEDTHVHVGAEDWRFRRGRGFRVWRKGGAWEGVSEEVRMGRGRGVPLCDRGWGCCWDGTRR